MTRNEKRQVPALVVTSPVTSKMAHGHDYWHEQIKNQLGRFCLIKLFNVSAEFLKHTTMYQT